ncbi:TlpA family protein disulfide reductase [Mucilaginibacter flavidus]|uniref:TlpA family protein disulfide reductase n=1 Tax=Mucilaginibacter flavidus TaxID=2949309 RepID=UPI0020939845|nr:TlpA disulfide reductase family protein [Mucilaginibacter flavidus]MCO5950990.1 TlpA family protein disulfide reductase [Mucilaginibacter flavidus]
MNKFISAILLLLTFSGAVAQQPSAYALVGLPCPDINFNEVSFYSKKKVSVADFKGQWLILDFWNRHCGTCIGKMPATDSLQQKFPEQVKVLLVGYTGSQYTHRPDNSIRTFYKDLRKRLHIDLPIAYDSVAFHRLAIGACPYIIVVDPKGIVRGVTTRIESRDMTVFLAGRQPVLEKATNKKGI